MRIFRWVVLLALGLTLGAVPRARADAITFTLTPAAALSGAPGSTVTWGYTIANNSLTGILALDVSAGVFVSGIADASPFDFPSVPAGSTVSGSLYAFTADLTPSFNSGFFVIDTIDTNNTLGQLTAAYSVTITPVPEPGSLLLLGTGLLALVLLSRRLTT